MQASKVLRAISLENRESHQSKCENLKIDKSRNRPQESSRKNGKVWRVNQGLKRRRKARLRNWWERRRARVRADRSRGGRARGFRWGNSANKIIRITLCMITNSRLRNWSISPRFASSSVHFCLPRDNWAWALIRHLYNKCNRMVKFTPKSLITSSPRQSIQDRCKASPLRRRLAFGKCALKAQVPSQRPHRRGSIKTLPTRASEAKTT